MLGPFCLPWDQGAGCKRQTNPLVYAQVQKIHPLLSCVNTINHGDSVSLIKINLNNNEKSTGKTEV